MRWQLRTTISFYKYKKPYILEKIKLFLIQRLFSKIQTASTAQMRSAAFCAAEVTTAESGYVLRRLAPY